MYVDFQEVKRTVRIEDVAAWLGLTFTVKANQLRGACPTCKGGNRSLCITPAKASYYCFGASKGGDCISLASHILGVGMKEAAAWIAELSGTVPSEGTVRSTVPQKAKGKEKATPAATKSDQPTALQRIADRLEHDHPAVLALGLAPETAQELGIGFDQRGMMKGRICIPLWRDGALAGFCGFSEEQVPLLKFPPQLQSVPVADDTNVVRLRPKAS